MIPNIFALKTMLVLMCWNFLLFLKVQSSTLTFCIKSPGCYEINDINFDKKWKNDLQNTLNDVQSLQFYQSRLGEENMLRIFSHRLPKLKRLVFMNEDENTLRISTQVHHALTPQITQKIFRSEYFQQLQELDMSNTYIQFRHFQFLQQLNQTIHSNLIVFNLKKNFLEKRAFKLLSKINFNGKLKTLSLAQNSLIEQETIDSIITMIKTIDGSKAKLTNLTVYYTSITTYNMIKLMDQIKVQGLISLNLGQNAFQHSISFDIPFSNTLFQHFSRYNFSSLKRLVLDSLDLDKQQLKYLKDWKTPQIQLLMINNNFITDDYFREWITRQKMPNLKRLKINSNDITDAGVQILVNNNFQNLIQIGISNNRRLSSNHIEILCRLNSSRLDHLTLSSNLVHEQSLRKLFSNRSFQNLEHLDLGDIKQGHRLFQYLSWSSMKKLKYLYLTNTDVSESFNLIFENNVTFPALKEIILGGVWINKSHIQRFINHLGSFGPQLELVTFVPSSLGQNTRHINVSAINFPGIPSGVYLRSQFLTVHKPYNSSKLQLITILMDFQFFATTFHYSFFKNAYKQTQPFEMMLFMNPDHVKLVCNKLKQLMVVDNVEKLLFPYSKQADILKRFYFHEDQSVYAEQFSKFKDNKQDFKTSVYLPYLTEISYIPTFKDDPQQEPTYLYYLNKIDMPHLNVIQIFNQVDQSFPRLANKLLQNNRVIKNLILFNSKLSCETLQVIFQGLYLPFLKNFNIQENQIEKDCLIKILNRHNSIKVINFQGNFLQTGIFRQIIKGNQLILQSLMISDIQIGNQEFSSLALINREFILTFQAKTINVNSEGIQMFAGNASQKLFPRCRVIDLGSNNINQQGVTTLLSSGMPFLQSITSFQVTNPNILNNLFSYPNRFTQFQILDGAIYGLNQNLDPRSTRHLQLLALKSSNLILEDFKVLSNLNFLNIRQLALMVDNIYDCQVLKYILAIAQNTQKFQIIISNQKIRGKLINDQCLVEHDPKQSFMKHLQQFLIEWTGEKAYIPKFYTYIYSKNQFVDAFALSKSLIGDDNLYKISKNCNVDYTVVAELDFNLLTDQSVSQFLKKPLRKLKALDLSGNEFTSQSLKEMVNKTFPELIILDLSYNNLGDKGIEYLTQGYFPQLQQIALNNVQMSIQGLFRLFEMKAPKLVDILFLNNIFNEQDLAQFAEKFPYQKFPALIALRAGTRAYYKNFERMNVIAQQKSQRPVALDIDPYRLYMENKAQILQT